MDSVCFDVIGTDQETNETLELILLDGPIYFLKETYYADFTRNVCFYPEVSGEYVFVWQLQDKHETKSVDTVVFTVTVNTLPVIEDQEFTAELCLGQKWRELAVEAFDADGDALRFEKLSGPGTIDETTGVIAYAAPSSGVYTFEVAVYDACGGDTAVITDYPYLNERPVLLSHDSTVFLCDVEEICFDVIASDPEGGPVTVTEVDEIGQFSQVSDTSGRTCFTPLDVDSAVYRFIYCLVDQCPLDKSVTPPCIPDTINITVLINRPPYFTVCPEPQEFNTCKVDTFCFDVNANDPEFETLTFNILSRNATIDGKEVCVVGGESESFEVVIEVADICGATDTCTVPVVINGNRPPVIRPLEDQQTYLCVPETFCFDAVATDDDYNLDSMLVNYGYYDWNTHRICIEVDTAGVYEIVLTAKDACKATDVDTALITVDINQPPVAEILDNDTSLELCEITEIYFKAVIADDNIKDLYISHDGYYNPDDSTICFTPPRAGEYKLSVYLEDYCNLVATDTITVNIEIKANYPFFELSDTTVFLCGPDSICLPVEITDADNDIMSITPSRGKYNDGRLCFVPYDKGDFMIFLTVEDSCGHVTVDTAVVTVLSDDVKLVCPGDVTEFLCEPQNLCYYIGGIPDGAEVNIIGTNVTYDPETDSVCFFSDCCLENNIRVEVTTACQTYSCDFTVYVQTNSAPVVRLPEDTTFWSCLPEEICLPVSVEDIDHNVDSIAVEGAVYDPYYQTACFTPENAGEYIVKVTAYDTCGAVDFDSVIVTVETNRPPVINYTLEDTVFRVCTFENICIPIDVTDPDNNLASIVVNTPYYYDADAGSVCFTPIEEGDYCFTVFATDSCGEVTSRQICVTVQLGDTATLTCPEEFVTAFQLCKPDTVSFDITIEGNYYDLTVEPADIAVYRDGTIYFKADTSGTYEITVNVEAECNSASCVVEVPVEILDTVYIDCPTVDDIFECFLPRSISVPMEIHGDYDNININLFGALYQPGQGLNIPIDSTGFYEIRVIAEGPCNADTCDFSFNMAENVPPMVTVRDTTVVLCVLEDICIPVVVDSIDNTVTHVLVEPFGMVVEGGFCFTPTAFEDYTFTVIAVDVCGASDTAFMTVTVMQGDNVNIDCPGPLSDTTICGPQLLCRGLTMTGENYQIGVYPDDIAFYENGQLCFTADTSGFYEITVIGYAGCNNDTCTITRQITVADSVMIVCPDEEINKFDCYAPYSINVPVKIQGDYTDLQISPAGASFINDTLLNIPTEGSGAYPVEIIATGPCNADTCAFTVNLDINDPPELMVQNDTTLVVCEVEGLEVQLKYHLYDPDGNIEFYGANPGTINDSIIYYYPNSFGVDTILVFAQDTCKIYVDTTIIVTIVEGPAAVIDNCPELPITTGIETFPTTIYYELPISPEEAVVEVTGGTWANDTLAVEITEPGTYNVNVIATALCGSDECNLTFVINEYVPPGVVACHDTSVVLCLLEPQTLCIPREITGTDVTVSVSRGEYINGEVCFQVDEPGEYDVEITVSNLFEGELRDTTCNFTVTVDGGSGPSVYVGEDFETFICEPTERCFPVTVTPGDFPVVDYDINYGTFNQVGGEFCASFDTAGVYHIILTVYDDCGNSAEDDIYITVQTNQVPVVSLGDDFTWLICGPTDTCLDVTVTDENLVEVYPVGNGYMNEYDQLCFTADTAGVYEIIVAAVDECEAVGTDTIYVTIEENQAPKIDKPMPDMTRFLCRPEPVCLPVEFSDPDSNIVSVTSNRGKYSNGELCFVPYDSGNFVITLTVTDSCGLEAFDTAIVRVVTERGIALQCPGDITEFLCEPQDLCYYIGGIPEGAEVKVFGTNVTYDPQTDSICFFSDCCLDNTIRVEATTACATYTCEFTVYVQTNSKPIVRLPKDTTYLQCRLEEICLPVAISDIDGNVDSVVVTGADYDEYYETACFLPNSSGVYTVRVTAYDSCGASNFDEINITVIENRAPVVDFNYQPEEFKLCQLTEICFPAVINDPDGNLQSIEILPNGYYNTENGEVCFTPDAYGTFWIYARATDTCEVEKVDSIQVTVTEGDYVDIDCPEPMDTILCEAGTVCIPIDIAYTFLPVVEGENVLIRTYPEGLTSYEDGKFCFQADTNGTYNLTLVAEAQCNIDSCNFVVNVEILDPLAIKCPDPISIFLCDTTTLNGTFIISSSVTEVIVTDTAAEPAYIVGNLIYIPVREEGAREIILTASGYCGEVSDSFTVTADFNTPPIVVADKDTTLTVCELFEVCLKFTVTDEDGNIDSIISSYGTFDNNTVCFNPADYDGFGEYDIIVAAYDACETMHADTLTVTFNLGDSAKIKWCPSELSRSACGPVTVDFPLWITPPDAGITILPNGYYDAENNKVYIDVDTAGTYQVSISVDAQCYDTSCSFPLNFERFEGPDITCPSLIDTLLCLSSPDTLCFKITVEGSAVDVTVKADNLSVYYTAGHVCVPVAEPGTYELMIIGQNMCGADTCYTILDIDADQTPNLFLPDDLTFERCPDDTDLVIIRGIYANDAESDVTITQVCGPEGAFVNVNPDSGYVAFRPNQFTTFEFCFEADDGCNIVSGSFLVDITLRDDCDVCLRVFIDGGECTPVGLRKTVELNVETNDAIAGFDILLHYDASALTFIGATIAGSAIEAWEYFTYNVVSSSNGLIRLVGIADVNNGPHHPPSSSLNPQGTLVYLEYQIANDQNLGDVYIPISFTWYDCGDNTFSDVSGTILFLDSRIYNAEGILIWDEDVNPDSERPFGMGAPDVCQEGTEKGMPLRCIEFINGGVCVIHPDSLDDRGDINLNNIAYEIGDAVLFTSYFIRGLSAFTINVAGQIAASDVNADGITLTVSDLAYLIRVIIGDASPYPKLNPYQKDLFITSAVTENSLNITTEAVSDIGAAYFVYDLANGVEVGEPALTGDMAAGMDLKYSVENGQLKMLVYNIGTARIPSGTNRLIEIPVYGEGGVNLAKAEIVDYQGQPYLAVSKDDILPTGYSLSQNYPNPFNPSTRIQFSLPQQAAWTLKIFNVTGKLVREFSGINDAGVQEIVWNSTNNNNEGIASGVYFYRLEANDFVETKKMILLK